MKMLKKTLAMLLALIMVLSLAACGGAEEPQETNAPAQAGEAEVATPEEPVKITIYYPDSSTAPFREDWLALTETAKLANADVTIEAIPEGEYSTPVNLALDTQENCPDVIMFQEIYGSKASLCMNGGVVSISEYPEWTPNFNAMVEKLGLTDQVNSLKLADGKRYAEIFAAAAEMGANQTFAPEPWFDDIAAEDAGMIANGAMFDLVETYREQFINGDVDVNDDAVWADYVAQLEAAGLQEYLDLYNEYRNQG